MTKIQTLIRESNLPFLEAELLMVKVLGLQHTGDILDVIYNEISEGSKSEFLSFIERRKKGEPIAYIIGEKSFWKHDFKVNSSVLIPRPDSETLIEAVLKHIPQGAKINILDLGTGSGCLINSLLYEYPNATGVAVDIDIKALEVAKENSVIAGVANRLQLVNSNWFETVPATKFHLIISNPPYIDIEDSRVDENVRNFEPTLALFASNNGLSNYEIIAKNAKEYLLEDGLVVVEIGENQEIDVINIFNSYGFHHLEICKDLAQINRCIVFIVNEVDS